MVNDFHCFSTIFKIFHRFSAIFNDFQRFLGARPYRGVSRQNLRILVAQKARKLEKVRNNSDTTPTGKPTSKTNGGPSENRLPGELVPFRLQAYFFFLYQCGSSANLGQKSIRQISSCHRGFLANMKNAKPPRDRPILGDEKVVPARNIPS